MKKAIEQYASVYKKYLETITIGGDKNIALSYAVQDMVNQVKSLPIAIAIATIIDEAEYLESRIVK